MGLDNSLIIKGKTVRAAELLYNNFNQLERGLTPTEFEFDYWRKCWNMRERMLDVFSGRYDKDEQEIVLKSTLDLYNYVEKVLKYFLVENNWEYNGRESSVFDWAECIPSIANAINDIRNFLVDIAEYEIPIEEFEIWWYDSY